MARRPPESWAGGNTGCTSCGPWLYYQDPGYGTPYPLLDGGVESGPGYDVNNFAAGNIIVKNPYTGGMTNPFHLPEFGLGWSRRSEHDGGVLQGNLSSFVVNEYTTAEYFMEDFGGKQDPFHLNIGVRIGRPA